jgi:hypothetical protein
MNPNYKVEPRIQVQFGVGISQNLESSRPLDVPLTLRFTIKAAYEAIEYAEHLFIKVLKSGDVDVMMIWRLNTRLKIDQLHRQIVWAAWSVLLSPSLPSALWSTCTPYSSWIQPRS